MSTSATQSEVALPSFVYWENGIKKKWRVQREQSQFVEVVSSAETGLGRVTGIHPDTTPLAELTRQRVLDTYSTGFEYTQFSVARERLDFDEHDYAVVLLPKGGRHLFAWMHNGELAFNWGGSERTVKVRMTNNVVTQPLIVECWVTQGAGGAPRVMLLDIAADRLICGGMSFQTPPFFFRDDVLRTMLSQPAGELALLQPVKYRKPDFCSSQEAFATALKDCFSGEYDGVLISQVDAPYSPPQGRYLCAV